MAKFLVGNDPHSLDFLSSYTRSFASEHFHVLSFTVIARINRSHTFLAVVARYWIPVNEIPSISDLVWISMFFVAVLH